jgi:hypothetical protein
LGALGGLCESGLVLFGFRWAPWAALEVGIGIIWVSLGALGGYLSQDWYYLDFAGRIEQLLKSGSVNLGFVGRIGRLYESGPVLSGFRWAH